MLRELLTRESRFPPLLGTGLAAVLMGAVAVVSAHASLPSRAEAAARLVPAVPPAVVASHPSIDQAKFAFLAPLNGFAVNSPFGLRKLPWEEGGRLHEGVDIAAPAERVFAWVMARYESSLAWVLRHQPLTLAVAIATAAEPASAAADP